MAACTAAARPHPAPGSPFGPRPRPLPQIDEDYEEPLLTVVEGAADGGASTSTGQGRTETTRAAIISVESDYSLYSRTWQQRNAFTIYCLALFLCLCVTMSTHPGISSFICSVDNPAAVSPCAARNGRPGLAGRIQGDLFVPLLFVLFRWAGSTAVCAVALGTCVSFSKALVKEDRHAAHRGSQARFGVVGVVTRVLRCAVGQRRATAANGCRYLLASAVPTCNFQCPDVGTLSMHRPASPCRHLRPRPQRGRLPGPLPSGLRPLGPRRARPAVHPGLQRAARGGGGRRAVLPPGHAHALDAAGVPAPGLRALGHHPGAGGHAGAWAAGRRGGGRARGGALAGQDGAAGQRTAAWGGN